MVKIIATEAQIRQLNDSNDTIELVDSAGNRIGVIAKSSDLDDIRIARDRLSSNEERLPYSAVLQYFSVLDAS